MKNRTVLLTLFFIYLAVILRMTVFRKDFGSSGLFSNGDFNFELFTDLIRVYHNDKSVFIYLFFGNIVTFMPFGFLVLPLVNKDGCEKTKSFWVTVLLGCLFSLCVEISQWAFGVGVSELDDLVLNTFGVFLGALCCLPFLRKLRK